MFAEVNEVKRLEKIDWVRGFALASFSSTGYRVSFSGRNGVGGRRGQSSMEYVFALSLILGFVVALMISGMRESEFNFATGSARAACVEWVAGNASLEMASLEIIQDGRNVDFSPVIYYWGGGRLMKLPDDLKHAMALAIQRTAAPSSPEPPANCFSSVNFDYCVVDAPVQGGSGT